MWLNKDLLTDSEVYLSNFLGVIDFNLILTDASYFGYVINATLKNNKLSALMQIFLHFHAASTPYS